MTIYDFIGKIEDLPDGVFPYKYAWNCDDITAAQALAFLQAVNGIVMEVCAEESKGRTPEEP